MTEKQMLEFAAKAIGLKYHAYVDHPFIGTGLNIGELATPIWNPLTEYGDTLRLAAATDLSVDFSVPGHVMVAGPCGIGLDIPYEIGNREAKIKAACLGITQAAAIIGEQMP
jgi:hypothetical protein